MQEKLFYISELIGKELNGAITVDEATVLNEWVNSSVANKTLFDQLHNDAFVKQQLEKFDRYDIEKNRAYLMGKLREMQVNSQWSIVDSEKQKTKEIQLWKRIAVAASVVGLLLVGYWLLRPLTNLRPDANAPSTVAQDVPAPDKNRAQIALADGTTVYLDSAANGQLANMNGVIVKKTDDGKIVYETVDGSSTPLTVYNTLTNPKGSKVIDMTLADGSRVWLNAGSSVTYPVQFANKERKVELNGEGYFEVAKNTSMPFKVDVAGKGEVEVLGTHFNINSYSDEATIKTTLLEGAVKISNNSGSTFLKPGQQSQINKSGEIKILDNVDIEQVMAWKNGIFNFSNADLQMVLRQLSRWYDVEIVFQGDVPQRNFEGEIQRNLNLSQILKILESNNVNSKIEGKKLIVSK